MAKQGGNAEQTMHMPAAAPATYGNDQTMQLNAQQGFVPATGNNRNAHRRPRQGAAGHPGANGNHITPGSSGYGGYGGGTAGPGGPSGPNTPNSGKRKMSKGKKIVIGVLVGILAALLAVGVAAALWINSIGNSMGFEDETQMNDLQDALATVEKDEAFYMLVLGSDARGDETSRSDVIMLSRIDPTSGTVHLISIPRDTMITIEGHGTQKINAAYAYGGPALAVKTVSEFAGVPISHYAEVHFDELENLVDMLGGVTVNVPQGFSAGNGGVSLSAGEQVLNGAQALGFARERYNVAGGDFGRAQAQRLVAEAIIKEVLATPATELPSVIGEAASCVSTDMSLTDIINLALAVQGSGLNLYSAACPSYTNNVNGVSYVCTMFDEWRTMMQLVDAGLDPEDTSVAIPAEQQQNEKLGAATNSPAPRDYHAAAAGALTTDDVAKVE